MRHFFVGIFPFVLRFRLEHGVNGFVRQIQEKRFFFLLIHPIQSVIRQNIGDVTFSFQTFTVNIQFGIKILTLTFKTDPFVKTFARHVIALLFAHVPFAHEGRFVARLLHVLRKINQILFNRRLIVHHFMFVSVQTR